MIMRRLQSWALSALAVLLVLVGAYSAGSRSARSAAKRDQEIDDAKRAMAVAEQLREVQREIDSKPPGAAADELRSDWMRK